MTTTSMPTHDETPGLSRWMRFVKKQSGAVPWHAFGDAIDAIREHLDAVAAKNAERNTRLAALETENAMLQARVTGLETRAMKGASGVRWGGVYEPDHEYQSGELCTCDGNLWVVTGAATSTRPGSDPTSWQLVLRRGKA